MKTKIVCTIGPSTWVPSVMEGVINAGMNCARVNGAFADPDELDKVRLLVRQYSNAVNLMVDVKGPEVRMNKFESPIALSVGQEIIIGNNSDSHIYPANYKDLYKFVKPGQRLVIGDGDVELIVEKVEAENMICKVVFGSLLKPGKALNLPGCEYTSEVLTEKDKTNLVHAIKTGWDSVSASFVTSAESAQAVKDFLIANGGENMQLIAKIENQEGVDNIDEILEIVDGIMVARGGLGVELGLEKVPQVQNILINAANSVGKPVIVATQMLESMIENPRPTRAEVNDIATSVLQGADAVMLSAESSAGKFPIEAVETLVSVSQNTIETIFPEIIYDRAYASITADALSRAAAEVCIASSDVYDIASEENIDAVIVVSKTGTTARLLARHNLLQPIYSFVSSEHFARKLEISKNIHKVLVQDSVELDRDQAVRHIIQRSIDENLVSKGQRILLICKTPFDKQNYFPNIFEILKV